MRKIAIKIITTFLLLSVVLAVFAHYSTNETDKDICLTLLSSLWGGIIAGLIASFLFSYIRIYWKAPNFVVSAKIAERFNRFTFKIQNNSEHGIGNIEVNVSYVTVNTGYFDARPQKIAYLSSKKGRPEVEIALSGTKRKIVDGDTNVEVKDSVSDFFNNNNGSWIEIVITYDDYHRILGVIKRHVFIKYKEDDVVINIFFKQGEIEPTHFPNEKNLL